MIKSRILRCSGLVARMDEDMSSFKILSGKLTEKIPIGRLRRRWEDHIRMDLQDPLIQLSKVITGEPS